MKSALLILAALTAPPEVAPPVDDRLAEIESTLKDHDSTIKTHDARLNLVERDLEKLTGKTASDCPCPNGGECICGDDCKCENCPIHSKAKASNRRAVIAGASWCGPCVAGDKERTAAGLVSGVDYEYFDIDERPDLKAKYGVGDIPLLLLIEGDEIKTRFVGLTGMTRRLQEWIGKTAQTAGEDRTREQTTESSPAVIKDSRIEPTTRAHDDGDASDDQIRQHLVDAHGYSWGQVQGMSRSQLKAAHNASHGGPAVVAKNYPVRRYSQPTIRYTQPAQYRPTTYFRPSYGYCPKCR